ncbi:MAG: diphthamide biosynthesis enzyme Dph2 [Methanomicrobium sp.]|nr:diphthamide biosynthesis enzyme Dph2 [Methanomicrobium sp.]
MLERLSATDAKTVALQFPEGLKRQAWQFADELKKHGYSVIISGSPCWGACDLDTNALNEADILIHYGHAPVDDTEGVIYEYLTQDIIAGDDGDKRLPTADEFRALLKEAVSLFGAESPKKIGLVTTIQHVHELPRVAELLKGMNIVGVIAEGGSRTPYAGQILGCSYGAARNTGCGNILFIGTGVFHPTGIALSAGVGGGKASSRGNSATVVALDPFMKRVQLINTVRLLRQRFAKIEKARSAERFGIIVSKKSGQRREELERRLASLSDKAYLVSLGEITPDSLLNLGFDAYVNTSCPRLAYDDQARYPVPMLSPQEFEIVCGVRGWEDYAIDEFDNV